MAKYRVARAAKGKGAKANNKSVPLSANAVRAIPCLILILGAIALFALLFYSTLKQAGQ